MSALLHMSPISIQKKPTTIPQAVLKTKQNQKTQTTAHLICFPNMTVEHTQSYCGLTNYHVSVKSTQHDNRKTYFC